MRSPLIAIALSFVASVAFAQSPYAGMQARSIKALSEQQIADLKSGRGMGMALPAELNGYPGPRHVLELSDQLGLSAEQTARIQSLFDSMKAEAVPLGERLLEQEAALDQQFAGRSITADRLKAATAAIGVTQGKLQETHLKYHLQTAEILTPNQIQRYSDLEAMAQRCRRNISINTTCNECLLDAASRRLLLRVKRTSRFQCVMSAYDPKRTLIRAPS